MVCYHKPLLVASRIVEILKPLQAIFMTVVQEIGITRHFGLEKFHLKVHS